MKIIPKKSLGQNFLIDKNIINKISNTCALSSDDNVLEIGPGTGNLTEAILNKNPKSFFVIEKDISLSENLKKRFIDKLKVINDDILKYDLNSIKKKNLIIFGNLPYNISSQILAKIINFSENKFSFKKLIFMFERDLLF